MTMIMNLERTSEEVKIRARHVIICDNYPKKHRIRNGSKHRSIALMCAEKDPLDCHRTILVARELAREGLDVAHILADGRVERHGVVMKRLLEQLGVDRQRDLFLTEENS